METIEKDMITDQADEIDASQADSKKTKLTSKFSPYWQRLSDRERLLLTIGLCFVVLLLTYLFIIEPLKANLDNKISDIESQHSDVLWMEQQQQLIDQLRQQNPVLIREDDRPLAALVEQTLGQFKLRDVTDRIVPEGNTVEVWMNLASFETLLNWINSIGKFGVTVKKIDVIPHEEGLGNVNLSLVLEK